MDEAQKIILTIKESLNELQLQLRKDKVNAPVWRTPNLIPQEDTLCIVVTKQGAKYFATPINGRWMDNVIWWMPVPPIPDI